MVEHLLCKSRTLKLSFEKQAQNFQGFFLQILNQSFVYFLSASDTGVPGGRTGILILNVLQPSMSQAKRGVLGSQGSIKEYSKGVNIYSFLYLL
jgi:hypothetical protein